MKAYTNKEKTRGILVNDDEIVKAFGFKNALCCDPTGFIETEELLLSDSTDYPWEEGADVFDILKTYNMTQTQLARRFDIPLRTVQNWCGNGNNKRSCPPYVIGMMIEILKNK